MYDATKRFSLKADRKSHIIQDLGLETKKYILSTVHRAENTDRKERLYKIFSALRKLSEQWPVVIPLHPRTQKMLLQFNMEYVLEGLIVLKPSGFLDMLSLEKNALLITTDSGRVQKESYFQRVPCVTLRDETEWVETIESGWNVLTNVDSIEAIVETILASIGFSAGRSDIDQYGDGRTSHRIRQIVEDFLSGKGKDISLLHD